MILSEKIKQLRTAANLTQPELAQAAGIEQSYLSKLENDKGSPSFEVISKIAAALQTDAMAIIEALDGNYVKENLCHIPEIAARAAEIRIVNVGKLKRRFQRAAALIVLGVALVLLGATKTLFSESVYEYYSFGVLKPGEPLGQFTTHILSSIGETSEQREQRLIDNRQRVDEQLILSYDYRGEQFVTSVPKGRRIFRLENTTEHSRHYNDGVLVFGMVLLMSGGFALASALKFRE